MFFYQELSHIGKKNPTWEKREEEQHCNVTHRGYGQEFVFEMPQSQEDREKVLSWLSSLPFVG